MSAHTVNIIKNVLIGSGALLWLNILGVLTWGAHLFLIMPVVQAASLTRFLRTHTIRTGCRVPKKDVITTFFSYCWKFLTQDIGGTTYEMNDGSWWKANRTSKLMPLPPKPIG